MRRNIPSPQREINDLEPPACFYYALKSVNLTVPLKYMGLNALVARDELFPNFRIHNILLAPNPDFLANTKGLDQLDPIVTSDHSIAFNYEHADVKELKPIGHQSVNSLVNARLRALKNVPENNIENHTHSFHLKFIDWSRFFELSPQSNFKDSLEPLMPHLMGFEI
jgi:hypothetical protein